MLYWWFVEISHNRSARPFPQNLSVSSQSITRYLALLVELMHLLALKSWRGNVGKRLTKSTKYFVRDSGLLHALLDIQEDEQLVRDPAIGQSFEGFAIEQICNFLGNACDTPTQAVLVEELLHALQNISRPFTP